MTAYRENQENASTAIVLVNLLLKLYNPMMNNFVGIAETVCDTALLYNKGHKKLRQQQAMIYYVKSEFNKADSAYSALMADQDSSFTTLKYSGCARFNARKWFDAIEPLEKAFDIDPTALDVCIFLGISIGRTYDANVALQYFEKAESLMEPNPYWYNLLIQYRAEMYYKTDNCPKGAELYYQLLLQEEKKTINFIQQIQNCYGRKAPEVMSDDERQRYLFINVLYAKELSEIPKTSANPTTRFNAYVRSLLKEYEEVMFLRGVDSLPMTSPDNKKSTLTREKLKDLIEKLL
jgi:tetratricopeptide (TPR) repeat protein